MRRALVLIALAGCAPIPPPDVLSAADQARHAPAVEQAASAAPIALAHADELRRRARRAFQQGDFAGAQFYGEQALAAFEAVVVEARAVRAQQERVAAAAQADEAGTRLRALDAEEQRVAADIVALETRLEALSAIVAVPSSGQAHGEREAARKQAAVSLGLQARLLCAAARLLDRAGHDKPGYVSPAELAPAEADLGAFDELAQSSKAAPIDNAERARASCLSALTAVRRAQGAALGEGGADALLTQLTAAGFEGARDDRGVVVTLRGLFDGDKLAATAWGRLDKIGAVAKARALPLLVVVHADKGDPSRDSRRAAAVTSALTSPIGARAVAAELAGTAAPVVDPNGKDRAANDRVEVVFVTPDAL